MSESDAKETGAGGDNAPDNAETSPSAEATVASASQPPAEATVASASQPPPSQAPSSGANAEDSSAEPASGPKPELEIDPLATAKAEAQKFREQLLRTAADFDNFRKRSRREHEDALRKGKETALKELLPVFDNLERAISSSERAPDIKSVADGLKLVQRQFVQTLDKLAVKRVESVGQPFDPARHEAIQHIESAEHPAGVVAMEVQSGYMIGEHLVRAALVAVSKGPPEASAETTADATSEATESDAGVEN